MERCGGIGAGDTAALFTTGLLGEADDDVAGVSEDS
jgi:hypothetical protein